MVHQYKLGGYNIVIDANSGSVHSVDDVAYDIIGMYENADFDEICNELGLSMTTAITMLAKKMTREKRIPFEVSMDPFYSASNMAALNDSIEEMRQGKTVTRTLEELEAMEHE